MRIISGIYGGRVLSGKIPANIRPTTDYARESLFDTLGSLIDIEGKVFLDLFAGTGAVGLEALSRNTHKVNFIDKSRDSINYIKSNIDKLEIPKEKYEIIKADAIEYLSNINNFEKFDFIFADPPYIENYLWRICQIVSEKTLLYEGGIIIYETDSKRTELIPPNFRILKEQVSGNAKFYLIH
ncbi:MAG: 16S rRNA (guanine(966)-N(2))-methyltransferase RsmD [Chloroherpetonaceae bacterium]